MKVKQYLFKSNSWENSKPDSSDISPQLIFVFGNREAIESNQIVQEVSNIFSDSVICGCSTAGGIYDTEVFDDCIIFTALEFEKTKIKNFSESIFDINSSEEVGKRLGARITTESLKHVFIISEGLNINGSALVKGLKSSVPQNIGITGGLAGDDENFGKTLVINNEKIEANQVVAIGLYGDNISISYGSVGGWDIFGPDRKITKSKDNILYELDGQNALELYKDYLGEYANDLPASGLRFPLCIKVNDNDKPIVRTILGVDEENQSIIFAGDVPQGNYSQLMMANFNRIIDGAISVANVAKNELDKLNPDFAILVSCVGRKLILQQRVEEEVEGVKDILGDQCKLTGFYSYGELAPFCKGDPCELHNQTMTVTAFKEE